MAWLLALVAATAGALPDRQQAPPPVFLDVTEGTGLRWGIQQLALRGWNVVETMGGGGGFVDYDGDGWLDIYLVSYSTAPQGKDGHPVGDALYRNNGDGTFRDVTAKAGIRGIHRGMGLAVGDYDNDGHSDLFVTAYGSSTLYHNEGDGTFRDVTAKAGVDNRRWGCSTTFLDYDRDGSLDLFVSNYLDFDPDKEGSYPCTMVDGYPFCAIAKFRGEPSVLYRNNHDGTFTDVSASAGITELVGKGMGVVAADLDDDGWIDVFQTNDSSPNFLFRNRGDGRFRDVSLEAGVALAPSGMATGAMAADAEDVDGDGRLDLLVTNFNYQGTFLYGNEGGMKFEDRGTSAGLALPTFPVSSFGARFLDYDNDGLVDLFVAAGHPFAPVSKVWPDVHFADPPFLFANDGRRFTNVAPEGGEALRRPYVGRGVAVGDYDNDGDPDVLLFCAGQPPRLLRNDGGNRRHWLGVTLVGTRSGRDAIGAKVTVSAGGRKRSRSLVGGASYLSASDARLLFGLGDVTTVDGLEVRWPSGRVDVVAGPLKVDRYVTLTEGSAADGVTRRQRRLIVIPPPLERRCSNGPPPFSLPWSRSLDTFPWIVTGRSQRTDPPEEAASTSRPTAGSTVAATPPPEESISPPFELPAAKTTSTGPPELPAFTRPPTPWMCTPPPLLLAVTSPETVARVSDPPLVSAYTLPSMPSPRTEPPELSSRTAPCTERASTPPPLLERATSPRTSVILTLPPELFAFTPASSAERSMGPPAVRRSTAVARGTSMAMFTWPWTCRNHFMKPLSFCSATILSSPAPGSNRKSTRSARSSRSAVTTMDTCWPATPCRVTAPTSAVSTNRPPGARSNFFSRRNPSPNAGTTDKTATLSTAARRGCASIGTASFPARTPAVVGRFTNLLPAHR
jgi:hypothetical protein